MTLEDGYIVNYPSNMPYYYSKVKTKDFYKLYGMTVSSSRVEGLEYAVTKGKVVAVKIKNGKKDAQKNLSTVSYDEKTGLVTVSSCEIQGSIPLSSNYITNKTKDIK